VVARTPRAKYVSGERVVAGRNHAGSRSSGTNVSERKRRGSAMPLLAAMTPSCEPASDPMIAPTPQNSATPRTT